MSATNPTTPTTTTRLRALLLDDDAVTTALVGAVLRCRGYEVRTAADGAAGVAALLDELLRLDALVVDLDLPERDGWSLLRLIRDAGGERELPVVVLAAEPTPALRAQLSALGADAVVDRREGLAAVARAVHAVVTRPSARACMRAAVDAFTSLLVPVPVPA
jgi:CheY-like chemotaxis protein